MSHRGAVSTNFKKNPRPPALRANTLPLSYRVGFFSISTYSMGFMGKNVAWGKREPTRTMPIIKLIDEEDR